MTAAYSHAVDRHLVAAFSESPVGYVVPGQQSFRSNYPHAVPVSDYDFKSQRYPPFGEPRGRGQMDAVQPLAYGEYAVGVEKAVFDPGMGSANGGSEAAPYRPPEARFLPSPYEFVPPPLPPQAELNEPQRMSPSPYTRDSFRQSKDDSGVFTDVRPAVETPMDVPSEVGMMSGQQYQRPQSTFDSERPVFPSAPRHPSISLAGASNGALPRPDSQYSPIIPSSAAPTYKPSAIPISATTRAVAQQPTYITPPSSPTPIAVNTVYAYAASPYPTDPARAAPALATAGMYGGQPYRPAGFNAPEGREICVECAMRDQDMADVDVTSPGVWDRESDVYYLDLCRHEIEEAEERVRARTSNSSSESHGILRPVDQSRPRAKGNRLTEPNLKLWLSMNPREPQARQQTIDLYIKTQTALLEAEALARARALQESRLLESKLKDTYDNLRRSTYEATPGGITGDENGMRLKASHASRRSASGPNPIPIGQIVMDGTAHNRQSQGREVTLLENGMIVEHVDVRKEEKERRREEKRERERERSRARKSSRGSGGAEVVSMYSTHSPLPHQTDSGFYTSASNGSGVLRNERPMSLSQASTRAMSTPLPLTPGSPGFGPVRPPNARVHSQVSLVDSQSISSASFSANRRSRFFAFKNWSEAWKSRESFAPSGVMSLSGSMMDMHLALDREKQSMRTRPTTVDLGSTPSVRHSEQWPRRASLSIDRTGTPIDRDRPKKKGFAKIWGIVTGHRNSKIDAQRGRTSQSIDRSEDNAPLAPPPPLSYLVNRTSRERAMSSTTHRTSTLIPTATTTPGSSLPTPTSIRNPWQEQDSSRPTSRILTAHAEEMPNNGSQGIDMPAVYSPEYDMRQRTYDPAMQQGSPHIREPSSPRPISVYSLHKSLPPLPKDVDPSQSIPSPVDLPRPRTMYDLESPTAKDGSDTLKTPDPHFRRDVRRQSFGGMSSRPAVASASTLPLSGRNGGRNGLAAPQEYVPYTELGMATAPASRSLVRLGSATDDTSEKSDRALGKRRSKFGLSSLLGKLTGSGRASDARLSVVVSPSRDGEMPRSESEMHGDGSLSVTEYGVIGGGGGSGSSRSRHGGNAPPSRMSVASRRAIEELVDQDPNFVAYRYPSVDQNISLLR